MWINRSTSWPSLGLCPGGRDFVWDGFPSQGLTLTLRPRADVPVASSARDWGCPQLPCSPDGAVEFPQMPALPCCPWEKQTVQAGVQLRLSSGMSLPPLIYSSGFDSRLCIITLAWLHTKQFNFVEVTRSWVAVN